MTNHHPEYRERMDALGVSVLIGFSVVLGLNQALVKLVNVGFAPVFQSGLRSACAFLPVLAYALIMRKRLSLTDGTLGPGIINGLLFSAEFCLLFLALDLTTVSRVSLFFYTMPLWVALGAHFLIPGDQLNLRRSLGLLLAVGGIAFALLLPDSGDSGGSGGSGGSATVESVGSATSPWLGDLLALLAAICWAAIALLTRTTSLVRSSPEMNLLYQLAISAVVLLLIAPLFGETVREPNAMILGIFAFQVIGVVAIGFVVWFWILSIYPVSKMASFSLLTPIFGVFSGWLIFDDALPIGFIASLAMVGAGLILVNRS
jgi:drug/metabolite transporter (DMT)-like permease